MKYQLTIGRHIRFEDRKAVRYLPGDVFEATEADLESCGDRLALVEVPTAATESDSGDHSPETGANLADAPLRIDPTEDSEAVSVETPEMELSEESDSGDHSPETGANLADAPLRIDPTEDSEAVSVETPEMELSDLFGGDVLEALMAAGIDTLAKLAEIAGGPELLEVKGIGKARAEQIRQTLMSLGDQEA